eukprot:5001294-Pyramimonas_sp.AAC.1
MLLVGTFVEPTWTDLFDSRASLLVRLQFGSSSAPARPQARLLFDPGRRMSGAASTNGWSEWLSF